MNHDIHYSPIILSNYWGFGDNKQIDLIHIGPVASAATSKQHQNVESMEAVIGKLVSGHQLPILIFIMSINLQFKLSLPSDPLRDAHRDWGLGGRQVQKIPDMIFVKLEFLARNLKGLVGVNLRVKGN